MKYEQLNKRTLNRDFDLSCDGRWYAIGRLAFVNVVTVTGNIFYH
jgi:hypothetical protein